MGTSDPKIRQSGVSPAIQAMLANVFECLPFNYGEVKAMRQYSNCSLVPTWR